MLLKNQNIKSRINTNKKTACKRRFVDPQGFEPRQAVPKTEVLPLHHGSVVYCDANLQLFFYKASNEDTFFKISAQKTLIDLTFNKKNLAVKLTSTLV